MKNNDSNLVIVESPTKAKTITRFLPKNTTVIASMGHIRDLPATSLGVDVSNHFSPSYQINDNKKKIVTELKKLAKKADNIYLASDPDREGEAIAWHIYELLKKDHKGPFHRITFHEITPNAILSSFEHPEEINQHKVDAQQARRILDRLVGYQISPLLGQYLNRRQGISAGRVQSVALRIIVERERLINDFKSVEYWTMEGDFKVTQPKANFSAKLHRLDGKEPEIPNEQFATELVNELETKASFKIQSTSQKKSKQNPKPPFITSTLQQAASSALHISTSQTMRIAQELYEGIDLGNGSVGLITYMRTDSVNLAKEATDACRNFIANTYGNNYLPTKTNSYKSGKSAQEAHEAIRPTHVEFTPDSIKNYLTPQQFKLYQIIWNRFVACQMAPAELLIHNIDIEAEGQLKHNYLFHTATTQVIFAGCRLVYDLLDPDQAEEKAGKTLPNLATGTPCSLIELKKEQKFTEPPARFSEATLVKTLEENGIGRPSTYASTISTILDREYIAKDKGRLIPTNLGFKVNDYLVEKMPELFQVKFTAGMESLLDQIEEGKVTWTIMLEDFYKKFITWLGTTPISALPQDDSKIKTVLDLIPDNLQWESPKQGIRKIYDDHKMISSLKQQVENNKPFSEKQWTALLSILVKYTDQIPHIKEKLQELNITLPTPRQPSKTKSTESEAPDEFSLALLGLINEKKTEWHAPVKRGKRTYDDKAFFKSLKQQVENGKLLSDAQKQSLVKIVTRYASEDPKFKEVMEKYASESLTTTSSISTSSIPNSEIEELLNKFNQITTWHAPVTKGKRTFNDEDFVNSLKSQFKEKKTLSEKQFAAAQKLAVKYGLCEAAPKQAPVEIGIACPRCQAPLVEREARGRKFISCSAFPKCRYTATSIETIEK